MRGSVMGPCPSCAPSDSKNATTAMPAPSAAIDENTTYWPYPHRYDSSGRRRRASSADSWKYDHQMPNTSTSDDPATTSREPEMPPLVKPACTATVAARMDSPSTMIVKRL